MRTKPNSILFLFSFFLAFIAAQAGATQSLAADNLPGWDLALDEGFDSALDPAVWQAVTAGGGFGNNELQFYTPRPENVRTRDGQLEIEARKEKFRAHPYTSGMVQTKASWTYCRVEIRAKLPAGQGLWPAFWMLPVDMDGAGGWPACGELDIMELLGQQPGTMYATLHYGMPYSAPSTPYSLAGDDFSRSWHDFAMEWLPNRITWLVDGAVMKEERSWFGTNPKRPGEPVSPRAPFDRPFYLKMNLAVGGDWPGYPDETTRLPALLQVDRVRVWTPGPALQASGPGP